MALEFTEKADSQMADLASRTRGLAFFYSGRDTSTGLVDAFMQGMGFTKQSCRSICSGI